MKTNSPVIIASAVASAPPVSHTQGSPCAVTFV
jgi:hypothetical protein